MARHRLEDAGDRCVRLEVTLPTIADLRRSTLWSPGSAVYLPDEYYEHILRDMKPTSHAAEADCA